MEETFDQQSQLPSLPLPKLEDTCRKYLESVKPFLTDEEYHSTEFKVELFQNGVGKELHEKLAELAHNSRNWLQEYWYDTYLEYRGSNPMISNISGGYECIYDFDSPLIGTQISRAANWIHSMAILYQSVIRQEIPVQLLGKQFPMDMTQFANFFCAGRIPGEKRDTQVHAIQLIPKSDGRMEVIANVKHIIVLVRGRIFYVKVIDSNDVLLHPISIQRQLESIVHYCEQHGDGEKVASLTAGKREDYFKAYKHLCVLDRQNKINIDLINQAIFAMAFEDVETYSLQQSTEHGILGGIENRWHDKSCQAITSRTGLIITTEDHVHFDGNVGCLILQKCADYVIEHKYHIEPGYPPQTGEEPIELKFIVDDKIKGFIKGATDLHQAMASQLGFIDQAIEHYGKAFAKLVHINPDTIIQLAVQLAYYDVHRRVAPTYESSTSRMFYHGRTDTMRTCTTETKAWCEAMFDPLKTDGEREKLFRIAAHKHDKLMLEACQGKGLDRHLFVLKKISEEEGIPLPELYKDKAYTLSGGDGNFTISSSTTGFTALHGGLAPMVEDGYGVFYSILKDRIEIVVSSWKSSKETDYHKMYNALVSSLDRIRDLGHMSRL